MKLHASVTVLSVLALIVASGAALGVAQVNGELAYDSAENAGASQTELQVAHLLDEIETASAQKDRASAELDGLAKRVTDARVALRLHMRALYRLTRAGMLPITGGFESLLQHAGRMRRLKRLVETYGKRLISGKEHRVALRNEVTTLGRAIEESRAKLNALHEQAKAAEAVSLDSQFLDTFSSQGPRPEDREAEFYGMRFTDAAPISRFESLRGSLAFPLSGDVIVRDASRAESDGPGLEFLSPAGTPVRAVAAGRVAFNDTYGSYGRLVIIDHGDAYYTVYGGLGIVEVRVGDDLSRSARIGAVGSEQEPSALFFEVRKGTRTIAPRPWLGL